jgi:Tol biopolymer transport system component
MRTRVLLVALFFSLLGSISAQKEDKKFDLVYKFKMQEARHEFLADGNTRAALTTYRNLLKEYTNDGMVNYRIGECHLNLKRYDLAVDYLQNARRIDSDVDDDLNLKLGEAYHMESRLDEALEAYSVYKLSASRRERKYSDITKRIASVEYAKKMMAFPVQVKIENLGDKINSNGGDYSPSISADGNTMVFTSRRSGTKGGGIDRAGDFKYFEDIYITTWDTVNNVWNNARPIEGKVNTEGHDASLSISPDGNKIFTYKNDGRLYIGDIFVSTKKRSGSWGEPKSLDKPINSGYIESSACLSLDGNKLFLMSERVGKKNNPQGRGDIYVAEKITKTTWGEPKNLGKIINSSEDEGAVFIHPNGKTLFFSSNGHLSIGGYDIFMSRLQEDGSWGIPENLGYPINTVRDDINFILSLDGKTAHYSSLKKGGFGERDIYKIDLTEYPILSEGVAVDLSILKGKITNGSDNVVASINFKDTMENIVAHTTCDEDGNYFITLPGGEKYTVTASAEGYASSSKEIDLAIGKLGKTHVQEEGIQLEKTVGVE